MPTAKTVKALKVREGDILLGFGWYVFDTELDNYLGRLSIYCHDNNGDECEVQVYPLTPISIMRN